MTPTETAPFRALAEVLRDLRDRFVKELGKPPSPHCGEFLGNLMAVTKQLEHLETRMLGLKRHDPLAYEALRRTMENT